MATDDPDESEQGLAPESARGDGQDSALHHTQDSAQDYALLSIQHSTCFLTTESGRIERENDPDHSAGPLLRLAGCAAGNIFALRSDIADGVAAELAALLSAEPPFVTPGTSPLHLDRYIELLSLDAKVPGPQLGLLYELPRSLENTSGVTLVSSDSGDGRDMQARLSTDGMPDSLVRLGFLSASDLWLPWCMALHNQQIASIAFAARLSPAGAD